jgi:putative ABC transport system permease protein
VIYFQSITGPSEKESQCRHQPPKLDPKSRTGKQIRLEVSGAPSQWSQIVGVVSNVKWYSESPREEPEVYESFLQHPVPSFSLMLRTASDPDLLASALRNTVAQVDVELPLAHVMSMPAVITSQRAGNPFFLRVMGTFALLALILSAIGISGLIAYTVGQRSHEIGIRMALGAKRHDVLRMVLGKGLKMTTIGGVVGLAMAIPLPRIFGSLFFDLQGNEPRVYFIVPLAILVVAVVATYVPARPGRSGRSDECVASGVGQATGEGKPSERSDGGPQRGGWSAPLFRHRCRWHFQIQCPHDVRQGQ